MMSKTIALGEICNIYKGKVGIQAAIPGLFPLVTTAEERASHNEFHFEGEAVCIPLVSATGHGHASIKRLQFESGRFCVGSILAACLPKDYNKTSAKFLYMYLSLFKDSLLVPLMQGSANVSLKIKDIEKVEVPDISFGKQIKIVDLIDRLKSRQDTILSELEKQQSYLKILRQTILQEAVQGKLTPQVETDEPVFELLKRIKAEKQKLVKEGKLKKEKELPPITDEEIPFELPKGWVWCRLGEICERVSVGHVGDTAKYYCDEQEGVRFLRSQNVRPGRMDLNGIKFITKEFHNKLKKSQLKEGDLLVVRVGANRGDACLVPKGYNELNCANIVFARPLGNLNEFLLNYFMSPIWRSFGNRTTVGSAQGVINTEVVENSIVPIPPFAIQQQIKDKIKNLVQYIDELEQQVINSQFQSQQLLQAFF